MGKEGGDPYTDHERMRVVMGRGEGGRAGFQAARTACMTHALGGAGFCKSKGCMRPEEKQGSAPAGPVESCRGIGTFPGGHGETPKVLERKRDLDRLPVWKNYFLGSGRAG